MPQLSAPGVVCAAASWVFAWLPSLLPGGTVIQGVSLGVSAAVGYAIGVAVAGGVQAARRRRSQSQQAGRGAQQTGWVPALAAGCALVALASGAWLVGGLNGQADVVGAPQYTVDWVIASAFGLTTFAALLLISRGLRAVARGISRVLPTRWPPTAKVGVSGLVTLGMVGLLTAMGIAGMRMTFDRIDASTQGQAAPTAPTRSGSPASLVSFESLGRQGREFVTQGSDQASIRTYAGLASASDIKQRAELAVADMLRAGGAQAPIWIGITTTGNGFVDPAAAQTAEAATGGQAALVAMQYSTLPSWLSFLVDQDSAREAGSAMYLALARAREQLPADQRPRLFLYGESLGAFGSAAPFAGMTAEEITQRIDGALWVGPPAATRPVSEWTYSGAPPVWQPVIDEGRRVRYAASPASTQAPPGEGPWLAPRILVLQNPTDPVVWFTPALVWRPAPWLADPRGPGVQPGTRWMPVLFFLQVALDLPQAVEMPSGLGHDYAAALPTAWQQILAEQGS